MTDGKAGRVWPWIALGVLAAVLGLAGHGLLFSKFMEYDDEGYVLISLRNFALQGNLYDQVYSQYGPFPYLLYDSLHRLFGFAFDNVSGRWITLINWLGTAGACAALVYRTSRSVPWAVFTLGTTFTHLWVMIHEPVHPGGLITFIVALGTWLGAEAWRAQQFWRFAVVAGSACAALLLTKINVGVFYFGAVVTWLAVNSAPASRARTLTWVVALGCTALPFGLMAGLFSASWVRILAIVFTTGMLGTLLAVRQSCLPTLKARHWLQLAGVMAAVIGILVAVTLLRGTSLVGLAKGVVLDPLKHPGVYFFPVRWPTGAGLAALISVSAVAAVTMFGGWQNPLLRAAVVAGRVTAGVFCVASMLELIPWTLAEFGLSYGLSLAWCFAIPLTADRSAAAVRSWVALVFIFQALQVYPVAGSQLNWGTFLWIPLLAQGLHEVSTLYREGSPRFIFWIRHVVVTMFVGITLFATTRLVRAGSQSHGQAPPLGLAGAESLRLQNDVTYALRILVENIRAHGDLLFSFPGMYSANFWTGLPTPTLANATHWFSLLSAGQQQDIIDQLARHPKAVMLVQRDVLKYLDRHGFKTEGPLHDWLMSHFEMSLSLGGYELWVHRGRSIAHYSVARAAPHAPGILETLTFTTRTPHPAIARIELCNIDDPHSPLISFTEANSAVQIAACDPDGRLLEGLAKTSYPVAIAGRSTVAVRFDPIQVSASFSRLLIVLRDSNGSIVGECLIGD